MNIKDILKVGFVICIIACVRYAKNIKEENDEKILNKRENITSKLMIPVAEPTSSYSQPAEPSEPMETPRKYRKCSLCGGTGRCGGCSGSGQIYSVFYGEENEVGEGRMKDCECCGGTGACPLCEGSGMVEDFGL